MQARERYEKELVGPEVKQDEIFQKWHQRRCQCALQGLIHYLLINRDKCFFCDVSESRRKVLLLFSVHYPVLTYGK